MKKLLKKAKASGKKPKKKLSPKQIGKRSINKGKSGEREASKALIEHLGVEAHRGKQYQGGEDSPDVKTSLTGLHIEVKRSESFNLYKALKQANTEKAADEVGVVLHRKNNQPWVVVVELSRLKQLASMIYLQTPDG